MKKTLILVGMLAIGYANAQYDGKVGINTDKPKATLDLNVADVNKDKTTNEGILAPRLSKTRVANITAPVEGTLVYVTNDTDSPISAYTGNDTKVEKITEKGYYHYNGTQWVSNNDKNDNIYNTNGTLSGDRTIEGNNKALKIRDLSFFGIGIKDLGSIYLDMIRPIQQEGFLVEGIPFASKKKIYSYDGFQSMSLEGNGDRPVVASADGTLKIGTATTGTGENIYNANGTLTGDRTVNTDGHYLIFKNTKDTGPIEFSNKKGGVFFYTGDAGVNMEGTNLNVSGIIERNKGRITGNYVTVNTLKGAGDRPVVADEDGNLKIGTATTGTGENIYNANGTLSGTRTVNTNGNNLSFTGAGKIGIGVATPTQKLDVDGSIKSSSLKGTGDRNVVASADGTLKIGNPVPNVRWITTGYSADLLESDNGGFVYVNTSDDFRIDILKSLPVGFSCVVVRYGTGNVTIGSGAGMSSPYAMYRSARGQKLRARYSAVGIIKQDASYFTITGDAVE